MKIIIAIDMECAFNAGHSREEVVFIVSKLLGEMFPQISVYEKGPVKLEEKTYTKLSTKIWNILSVLSKYSDIVVTDKFFRDTFLVLVFDVKE